MSVTRPGLGAFNELDHDSARERLLTCLDVPRWADEVLAGRPYDDLDQVDARMSEAAESITDEELERALARHPRIGERVSAGSDVADPHLAHSAREQAGVDPSDEQLAWQMLDANRAYEERFGRVFIIRAAGRTGPEILQQLRLRLDNTDERERAETIAQLVQIAQLRAREMLS